jgi:hypothetical protein
MKPIDVIITEMPSQSWAGEWIPLITASIAVIVSIYSICLAKRAETRASRPFLWMMNFASTKDGEIINHPDTTMWCISNAPAKVNKFKIIFRAESKTKALHEFEKNGDVKYPSDKSQYTYKAPDFEKFITELTDDDIVTREIEIEYTSLSGGKKYKYSSYSTYRKDEKVWNLDEESAS